MTCSQIAAAKGSRIRTTGSAGPPGFAPFNSLLSVLIKPITDTFITGEEILEQLNPFWGRGRVPDPSLSALGLDPTTLRSATASDHRPNTLPGPGTVAPPPPSPCCPVSMESVKVSVLLWTPSRSPLTVTSGGGHTLLLGNGASAGVCNRGDRRPRRVEEPW